MAIQPCSLVMAPKQLRALSLYGVSKVRAKKKEKGIMGYEFRKAIPQSKQMLPSLFSLENVRYKEEFIGRHGLW
jgi:hypothetical protein